MPCGRKRKKKRVVYKIEYGRAHLGGTGIKGIDYHISRILSPNQTKLKLKKLNKKWEYTSLWRKKPRKKWEVIG